MEFRKLCVLGLGYIGLPTASTFATHGLEVVGVDVNPHVLATLRRGEIHIHEPGLRVMVQAALRSGNLRVSEAPEPADAFIIAVPTPFYEDEWGEAYGKRFKKADMRAVQAAAEAIVPVLQPGNLVILESTSPPQTTAGLVAPILERSGLKAGRDFHLAYSPERVLPGQILRELIENARVIGGITPESAEAGKALYATFVKGKIITTDATTAEMVKIMENTYRDVNIAIANEFSRLAEAFGVDVWEAIEIANLHPRVNILRPGPGVGGHCISVDPWFFVESAPHITDLIYTARTVNDSQPHFALKIVQKALGSLQEKRIAALGLAYKPDVDDLRESPAIEVARLMQSAGAQVIAYEPYAPEAQISNLQTASTLQTALQDADAVVLLVGHTQFGTIDPHQAARLMSGRVAVDMVKGWDAAAWQAAGFVFHRLGVGK